MADISSAAKRKIYARLAIANKYFHHDKLNCICSPTKYLASGAVPSLSGTKYFGSAESKHLGNYIDQFFWFSGATKMRNK